MRDVHTGEWRIRHNHEVEDLYHDANIAGTIKTRRLQWAGHVARMEDHRWPRKLLDFIPTGKRPPGRPRKRWSDGLHEDLQQAAIRVDSWRMAAMDRRRWRRKLVAARGPLGLIA